MCNATSKRTDEAVIPSLINKYMHPIVSGSTSAKSIGIYEQGDVKSPETTS